MAGSTDRLGLYKAGGGSSEAYGDDEVIDVDRHNDNFDKIDSAVGAPSYASTSRPSAPFDGQLIWETDTGLMKRWSAALSDWMTLQTTPTGVVADFSGATAPSGWLLCDGASLSRTTYAALFAVIGTTYGSVDATHFTLPNAKGKSIVGVDTAQTEFNTLGKTGGAKTHTLTIAEMPSHDHSLQWASPSPAPTVTGGNGWYVPRPGSGFSSAAPIENTGGGDAHNNLSPYLALNKIIKF